MDNDFHSLKWLPVANRHADVKGFHAIGQLVDLNSMKTGYTCNLGADSEDPEKIG